MTNKIKYHDKKNFVNITYNASPAQKYQNIIQRF